MRKNAKVILSLVAVVALVAAGGFAFAGEKGKEGAGRAHHGKWQKYRAAIFLKRLAELDTNKDKQVSRDEFNAGVMKRFDGLDANHDGFVTKEEMQAAAKKFGEGAFGKLDKNGDGKIGKDEFPGAPERFAALDKNSDGFLTKDELKEAGEKIRERLGDRKPGERIWARLDANKDGKISRDEYQSGMNELFQMLDRNGDGVISEADRGPRPLSGSAQPRAHGKRPGSGSEPALP